MASVVCQGSPPGNWLRPARTQAPRLDGVECSTNRLSLSTEGSRSGGSRSEFAGNQHSPCVPKDQATLLDEWLEPCRLRSLQFLLQCRSDPVSGSRPGMSKIQPLFKVHFYSAGGEAYRLQTELCSPRLHSTPLTPLRT